MTVKSKESLQKQRWSKAKILCIGPGVIFIIIIFFCVLLLSARSSIHLYARTRVDQIETEVKVGLEYLNLRSKRIVAEEHSRVREKRRLQETVALSIYRFLGQTKHPVEAARDKFAQSFETSITCFLLVQ